MKCVICRSGNIEMQDVSEEIQRGNDIVLVPVRIPVCQSCGERYYDQKTMRYLEELKKELSKETLSLKGVGKVLTPAK